MFKRRKIKISGRYLEAFLVKLFGKNLILIKGSRGFVMCGYLDLKAADKFCDVAVKVTGVSTINDALKASVHSCSSRARRLGIHKGQPLKEALRIIV